MAKTLDPFSDTPYVAGWSKCEAETIKATAANVLRTAHALADAITEPAPEPVAA